MTRAKITLTVLLVVMLGLLVLVVLGRGATPAAYWGVGWGAIAGGLNIAVAGWLLARTLRRRPELAVRVSVGGFFVRMLLLLGLTFAFWKTDGVDEMSFAVSFMIFFFAFLFVEIVLLDRVSRRSKGAGVES